MKANSLPYRICHTASLLFSSRGYNQVSLADIASETGITEAELYAHFGNKQDIILFLYQSIHADWRIGVESLNEKKLSSRIEKAFLLKLDLIAPYAPILSEMLGLLMQNSRIGVQAPYTSNIRAMGLKTMAKLVEGASDSKIIRRKITQLPSILYVLHWGILFLYIQSGSKEKAIDSVKLLLKFVDKINNYSLLLSLFPILTEASNWANRLIDSTDSPSQTATREILRIIFKNRKATEEHADCRNGHCEICMKLHEAKINFFVDQSKPIHFILPAFPAKSPNLTKVIGKMPDLGEEIALTNLQRICTEIKTVYPPGAEVTICSDGRIFSELVGVSDDDISLYVAEIKKLIDLLKLENIHIVNLEDLLTEGSFNEIRSKLLQQYAEPIEELEIRLKSNAEFKSLFNGIHRFITDDRKVQFPTLSANKVKEESKSIALKVIQHSNAWTRFLVRVFPDAFRLSIHPYPAHSEKTGIELSRTNDNWLTPWHGVIVLKQDGYVLMKRSEAESAGAKPVLKNGIVYYYEMSTA
jgi:pyoverdine/dityrosine biosynthesis protein Dit1/AcrR family transcriptional regulator